MPQVGKAGAPKVMADLIESLLGAVYLDTGGDLEVVTQVREIELVTEQRCLGAHFLVIGCLGAWCVCPRNL